MLEKGGREVGVGREAAAKPSPKTKRLSRRMACVIVSENNVMHGAFNSTPFCSLRLYFAAASAEPTQHTYEWLIDIGKRNSEIILVIRYPGVRLP